MAEEGFPLKAKITLSLLSAAVAVVSALLTTSFTVGTKVTEAENQRNQNTAEILQIKKVDEERDRRIDELLRLTVSGFAELRAQMALVLPRLFPPGKVSWWERDNGIFTNELVDDPQLEMAPFQVKPLFPPIPLKDRLVALENLRQRIIEIRAKIDQLAMSEKVNESWRLDQAKIDERHALEIEYEKLKTQEVILSREILSAS